jgi:hypothetical protein
MHQAPRPGVECAVERLGQVTLAQLAEDFDERYRVAMLP